MKRHILSTLFLGAALFASAQDEPHIDFFGYPVQGDINAFTSAIRPRYPLQKKVGGDNYNIYKGTVLGHTCYLKADYSRKSHTVYRVTVTPKNIDQNAMLDSLQLHYGEPQDTRQGYKWDVPGGAIFFNTPEGYDPILIYLDMQGVQAFKKEKP